MGKCSIFDTLFQSNHFFAYNYSFARTTIFKSQLCEEEEKSFSVGVRKYSRFFIKMHTSPADYLTWGVGQDFFLPLKKIQFSVSLKVHLENNLQICEYAMISKKKSVLDVTQRPRLNSM